MRIEPVKRSTDIVHRIRITIVGASKQLPSGEYSNTFNWLVSTTACELYFKHISVYGKASTEMRKLDIAANRLPTGTNINEISSCI